jgi:asparagine synthase (glutamine-hydrolysing)
MSFGVFDWQNNKKEQYPALIWQNNIGLSADFDSFSQADITVITDARIDNHAALCHELGISTNNSNAALCCQLYTKYGHSFAEKLYGDFAVIVIDKAQKKVIAATDLFAIRPIFFAFQANDFFAFSFALKPLISSGLVNKQIDEQSVYYFLCKNTHTPPSDHTLYQSVKTVKSGHFLVVTPDCFFQQFYWNIPERKFVSHEKYYSLIFRELLFESITNRAKKYQKIATQLSGGIDSSSVTATLAINNGDKTIVPMHIDTGHNSTNEKPYIEALKQQVGLDVRYLSPSPNVYDVTIAQIEALAMPSNYILPFSFYHSSYELIQAEGLEVLFTGHDGDSVVGYGRSHIDDMIQKKDWPQLKTYLLGSLDRDLTPIFGQWPQWNNQTKYHYAAQWTLLGRWREVLQKGVLFANIRVLHHDLGLPYSAIFSYFTTKIGQALGAVKSKKTSFFNPDFEELYASQSIEKFDNFENIDDLIADYLADNLNQTFLKANQETTLMARRFGFEVVHPFEDRKLLEFCMFVPDKVRFGATGLGRMPLRDAMAGILPDKVRLRRSKTFFDEYGLESVRELLQNPIANHSFLWNYVAQKPHQNLAKQVSNTTPSSFFDLSGPKRQLMKHYFLHLWLDSL